MTWLRRGFVALLALAALAALGGAALVGLAGSERGAAWLVARLVAAAPELTIARVRGSLRGGLVLDGVVWRSTRDELAIESLALDWNAAAALTGTIAFDRVAATRASYRRLPGAATAPPATPLALPWPVRIDDGHVDALTVTVADRSLPFATVRLAATLAGGRLALDTLTAQSGDFDLAARGSIGLDPVELDLATEWSGPLAGAAARGSAALAGFWPTLRVQHTLAAPFAAVTDGTLDFSAAPRGELATTWQDLRWPGVAVIASPSGRLTLAGDLAAYRYDGEGTFVASGRAGRFTARGTGRGLELAVDALDVAAGDADAARGTLRGRGTASLAARTTELAVTAEAFDPAWIDARWPGRLNGTSTLRAALAPEPNAALAELAVDGELRGYAVALHGGATLAGRDRVRLENLRLDSADNRVVLSGTLDAANAALTVDAEFANIDLLVPDAEGALRADLTLDGPWRELTARGEVAARALQAAGFTLARLEARGTVGFGAAAPVELTLAAQGLERGTLAVERLDATITGTTAAHTAAIEAAAAEWSAALAASGGLAGGVWRGTVASLTIDEPVLGPWRLEEPAALMLARGAATLATACLLPASNARWCAELDVRGASDDRIAVAGQNLNLAALRPVLPAGVAVEGVYQLSASLFDVLGEPRGALAVTGDATRASLELGNGETFAAELEHARAGLTLTAGRLELQASLASTNGGNADVRAEIADVRADDSAIDGALRVQWPDLRFLTLLLPDLDEVEGQVDIDLGVGGTVAEPQVTGGAAVHGGRIVVPRWGFAVEDIEGTAMSSDGRGLAFDATGRAGDGRLTLRGTTTLSAEAGWPTRLALSGDAVPLVQLRDAQIRATPNLDIDVALPRVAITGSVHVPSAELGIDELPPQAVRPSPDAVVHGQTEAPDSRPLLLSTDVDFTLGDDVRYSGLNLDTKVSGQLRIATEPGRSATASGTLRLEGTYNAYGQRLELERGRLLFSGPLDDPGLDVRAVRTIDTTEVGVELAGTVRAPRTRIVSTPAMSEVDALSYLLFGRPASGSDAGIGAAETTTLQTAAISLGLQQALPVVQRIGTSLGLDEFSVQTTAADAGELMAGKYLSPKLYIRYSYGLFNRIGGLLLRFKVNERLSIETRSGEQKSMDLLYTVEKD